MSGTKSTKRSRKNRRRAWSVFFVLIVLAGAGYYYYRSHTPVANTATTLETSTLQTGDIILTATGPGTLVTNQDVSFGFKNSGQVSEVDVKLGDKVEAGQVLAKLGSNTLDLEYVQAQANLEALSSPAQIATAEQTVQDAKQSFDVARNNLQYAIGPDMLYAEEKVMDAQDKLQQAEAAVQNDPTDANKQNVSVAQSELSKAQDSLTYVKNHFATSYTLNTFTFPIRNADDLLIRKELIAPTDADILGLHAAYDLAKSNLTDAQNYLAVLTGNKTPEEVPASSVTAITDAKIALDQAKANLDAASLVAPISGTITSLSLNVGDRVGTSAVITISSLTQPYTLDVYLDETDWDQASIGYDAKVTFDLLPNNQYPGKIIQVYPMLDTSSNTPLVHILVQLNSNINVDLPAGASASVDVTGGIARGVVIVPTSALKETQPGSFVVYLMQNGKPAEQAVEIGLQDIINAEVKSGLKPGDVVLTNAPSNQ